MRKRWNAALAGLITLWAAVPAMACLAGGWGEPSPEAVKDAAVVVVGRVSQYEIVKQPGRGREYARFRITVDKVLKGQPPKVMTATWSLAVNNGFVQPESLHDGPYLIALRGTGPTQTHKTTTSLYPHQRLACHRCCNGCVTQVFFWMQPATPPWRSDASCRILSSKSNKACEVMRKQRKATTFIHVVAIAAALLGAGSVQACVAGLSGPDIRAASVVVVGRVRHYEVVQSKSAVTHSSAAPSPSLANLPVPHARFTIEVEQVLVGKAPPVLDGQWFRYGLFTYLNPEEVQAGSYLIGLQPLEADPYMAALRQLNQAVAPQRAAKSLKQAHVDAQHYTLVAGACQEPFFLDASSEEAIAIQNELLNPAP